MKNKILNINKNFMKKKIYIKKEIKKKIIFSIIQNLNVKPNTRALSYKKLTKINLKSSISKQNNNICLKTGKIKGVFSKINTSRHLVKKLSLTSKLQNFKINSW